MNLDVTLTVTPMADGNYWTPYGGRFTVKGEKIYWRDGDIGNNPLNLPLVVIPRTSDPVNGYGFMDDIDYSAMSDEERAEKIAVRQKEREEREAAARVWREEHDALLASAKSKLTPEEYEACLEEGRE